MVKYLQPICDVGIYFVDETNAIIEDNGGLVRLQRGLLKTESFVRCEHKQNDIGLHSHTNNAGYSCLDSSIAATPKNA